METCCIYTEAKNRSCSPAHSDLSGMCPVRIPEKITTPLPLSSQPHENNQITFKTPPFDLSEQRTYALSVSASFQKQRSSSEKIEAAIARSPKLEAEFTRANQF